MDWWMDAYQAGKAAGRKDGWLAGCNGGERRAGKAKWIMTMWGDRWDVQCCVACLPRPPHAAAAAPDRAAVGRRSVWTPLPSPAITASSDRETTSLLSPARSPLITVTPRMCCPRPHPPPPSKAQQTCRFLVPLLLRLLLCSPLLSLPLLVSYRRPSTSNMFAFPSALSLLLPESYPSCSSLSKSCCFIFLKTAKEWKRRRRSIHSAVRHKEGRAAAAGAAGARLVLHDAPRAGATVSAQWKRRRTGNIYIIISSPSHCQNMFPESWRRMKKTTTTRLSSPTRSFLFFFSWIFPPLRLGPTPVGSPKPGKAGAGPGKLAVRHRYTDGTLPRHCIISGASHVTPVRRSCCVHGVWVKKNTSSDKGTHARART